MKKNRTKNNLSNRNGRNFNIPTTQLSYSGPLKIPQGAEQNDTTVMLLSAAATLSSSAGGVIDLVINNDPSGYTDWSSFATIYDEFRVLSMEFKYVPRNRYSKTTTTCIPVFQVIDRDSVGALSSVNATVQYSSCKIRSVEDPFTEIIRMIGTPGAQFITTASPTWTFSAKFYQSGYSASTNYGDFLIHILVQFRGKN
jgi:hypothetical protein